MADPIFAQPTLTQLNAKLHTLPGPDLLLDSTSIGQTHLIDIWEVVFQQDHLKLGSFTIGEPDATTGNFTVSGKVDILQFQNITVHFTFFGSRDANAPATINIECLLMMEGLPTSFDILNFYPDLPGYLNYNANQPEAEFRESFLRQIKFTGITTAFSSFNFFQAKFEMQNDPATVYDWTLDTVPQIAGQDLQSGLNFAATVAADGSFWDVLKTFPINLTTLSIFGAISADLPTGLITIGHDLKETNGQYPTFSIGQLDIELQQLRILSGMDPMQGPSPGFLLNTYLGPAGNGLELSIVVDPGSGDIEIIGNFSKGITLASVESLFGLSNLAALLPTGHALGALTLNYVAIDIGTNPVGLESLEFHITTQNNILLFNGKLSIKPTLVWNKTFASGATPAATTLTIIGDLNIGSTEFMAVLHPAQDAIFIRMKNAHGLDLTTLVNLFFAGLELPNVDIVDFEFDGDFKNEVFEFELNAATDWEISLGGKQPIILSQIGMSGTYDSQKDVPGATKAKITATINASFSAGSWIMLVEADWDQKLTINATIPSLPVTDLIYQFLHLVPIPIELPDFTIHDLNISVTPSTKEFNIQGGSVTPFDFFDGLSIQIQSFQVERKLAGTTPGIFDTDATIGLQMDVGGVKLDGIMSYSNTVHPNTTVPPTTEWVFTLAQLETPIPFGALIANFGKWIGVELPMFISDLNLQKFYLQFNVGAPAKYFVLSGAVYDGERELGQLTLLAEKVDDESAYMASMQQQAEQLIAGPPPPASSKWDYMLTVEIELNIDLSDLPIAGPQISSIEDLKIHAIDCTIASRNFALSEVQHLVDMLPQGALKPPVQAIDKGTLFTTQMMLGNSNVSMAVPLDTNEPQTQGFTGAYVPPDPLYNQTPVDKTKWFPVHKNFGAFALQRIGIRFKSSEVFFLLDAYFNLDAIQIGLAGLGIGSPFDHFDPTFNLDGLSVAFSDGPVTLGGGFLKSPTGLYEGSLIVDLASIDLNAVGAYGQVNGFTSFFVFALIDFPVEDPSFFSLEGLAFGMGYNSHINLPTINRLRYFSLVQAAMPSQLPFQQPNDPMSVLRSMSTDITPSFNEEWLAAGIRFSSFELIQSFALLVVQLGRDFEIGLIGFSRISVPSEDPDPIGYAEIAILASYDPEEGTLLVGGELTRASYVLSRQNQLSGGFAFAKWFKGPNDGEFVYSLGGYNPHFTKPSYYPVVPRLRFTWRISSQIGIVGDCYFALVPHCIMAGGRLEAIWHSGDLRAWFTAYADFLLHWKPFFYQADIGIRIGVSFRLHLLFCTIHITLHVSVGLSLHGPTFGGRADIHLSVISFSVSFGAGPPKNEFITWPVFKSSFLPIAGDASVTQSDGSVLTTTQSICGSNVTGGLVKNLHKDTQYTGDLDWIINPLQFAIQTFTTLPSKSLNVNKQANAPSTPAADEKASFNTAFGIGPAGVANAQLQSEHQVQLQKFNDNTGKYEDYPNFQYNPAVKNVPGSMWSFTGSGEPPLNPPQRVLDNALTGILILPQDYEPDQTCTVPVATLLYETTSPERDYSFTAAQIIPADFQPTVNQAAETLEYQQNGQTVLNKDLVLNGINNAASVQQRAAILNVLTQNGFTFSEENTTTFGTSTVLTDWPEITALGAVPE